MTGVLKEYFPDSLIYFIGKEYTRPVIEACEHVDQFLDGDYIVGGRQLAVGSSQFPVPSQQSESNIEYQTSSIQNPVSKIQHLKNIKADVIIHVFPVKEICKAAKKAGIPMRIGTSHRWFTWLYCNKLLHFSRKNSNLHEAQLNLRMLEPLGIKRTFSLNEIPDYYGLSKVGSWQLAGGSSQFPVPGSRSESNIEHRTSNIEHTISSIHPPSSIVYPPLDKRFNLILHPKSKGSAREWGLDNYSNLIRLLPEEKFRIIITGTKEEGSLMRDFLQQHENRITDMTGKLTLSEMIALINRCDGIVAASTGPLHLAAAMGKYAIGLYAPMKPIYPKRWAPLGFHADYLFLDKDCNDCRHSLDCKCIRSITPEDVTLKLEAASAKLF